MRKVFGIDNEILNCRGCGAIDIRATSKWKIWNGNNGADRYGFPVGDKYYCLSCKK